MPFIPFHEQFPHDAAEQTRGLLVAKEGTDGLPLGKYDFLELYCADRGCDCRRVIFSVYAHRQGRQVALLNWGWEPLEFYRSRFAFLDEEELLDLKGPSIQPMAPQTELAPAALWHLAHLLKQDADWRGHILEHYEMFRTKIDSPTGGRRKKQLGRRRRRGRK